MFKDITLGQYYPGNSVVHRADPRTKILITLFFLVSLFLVNNWWGFLPVLFFLGLIIVLSGVSVLYVLRGLKAIWFLIVITAAFNIFFTDGKILFSYRFIRITYEGLNLAGFMAVRICLLIVVTSMMTLTTTPIALTDGLETLLRPLKKLKVPVHEFSMMMTIALRFIPTIMEETDKIIKAQSARGADFESGNLWQKAKAMIPIFVPLFVSAFRRADELATAMECRCYQGDVNRTKLKRLKFGIIDFFALLLVVALGASLFVTEAYL